MKTTLLPFLVMLSLVLPVFGQTAPGRTGSVSGRVLLDGKPVQGVEITLTLASMDLTTMFSTSQNSGAVTDVEGRYTIVGVAAGSYRISAYALAYVGQEDSNDPFSGRTVTVREGETVEKTDFALIRGGVITGRLMDADGQPVAGERLSLTLVNDTQKSVRLTTAMLTRLADYETDDRGIYRIYGLAPGRYLISAGADDAGGINAMLGGSSSFRRTYYPGVTEEAQAKQVEVKSGDEVSSLDFKLVRRNKGVTYTASGRVIETDTGKPVPGVMIAYSGGEGEQASFGMSNIITNSAGEFKIENLKPNRYRAMAILVMKEGLYADPLQFEITSDDLTNLEIKASRGLIISGTVAMEGGNDPAILSSLSRMPLTAEHVADSAMERMEFSLPAAGMIKPDGTFRISGVRPGKVRLSANEFMGPKGISLVRIERNGIEIKGVVDLSAADDASGFRLVFAQGNSTINGQVEVTNGTLPEGTEMMITLRRDNTDPDNYMAGRFARADARGQFVFEGVVAGNYKLNLTAFNRKNPGALNVKPVEQTIVVSSSAKQTVTLKLDLSAKHEPEDK